MNRTLIRMSRDLPISVLHIFSGDLWAGAEVTIFNLVCELKSMPGLSVIAVSLNEGVLVTKLKSLGVEVFVVPECGRSFMSILSELFRLFKNRRIDVVHAHRYKENLLAWMLAMRINAPVRVSTIHGITEVYERGLRFRAAAIAWANMFLLKRVFTQTIVVSSEIGKVLHQEHGFSLRQMEVIHNGIPVPEQSCADTVQLSVEANERKIIIGTIGRCVPVKGFDLFIEIAERLCKDMKQVVFVLVGDGPEKQKLEQSVTAKGLEGRVVLLPSCEDPAPHYRAFDLYLNTSLHEGIPLTILEAMAWGKPVVAPNVGGIPEIIDHGETGFLVDGRDPEYFLTWCVALVRDYALRARVGRQARIAVAERFSAPHMAASYASLYARLARTIAADPVLECGAGCR